MPQDLPLDPRKIQRPKDNPAIANLNIAYKWMRRILNPLPVPAVSSGEGKFAFESGSAFESSSIPHNLVHGSDSKRLWCEHKDDLMI
jgi:hypothetical protein